MRRLLIGRLDVIISNKLVNKQTIQIDDSVRKKLRKELIVRVFNDLYDLLDNSWIRSYYKDKELL